MRSRLLPLACLLSALAVSAPGGAASRKEAPKQADLSRKEATKVPESDLAGDITRRKAEKAEQRPALVYDQYRQGVELQVASKRREQIETLQKIIQLGPSENEAPNLVFRLAELYWEESKFFFFESNRKDDEIIVARAAKNETALRQAQAEKKAAANKSETYQALAIDQYRTIVRKYPKYERMDEVLFFLGHNMWDSGKEKDAVTVYRKLIKDHKGSRYLPDAWVAIGQYYFNNSQGKVNMLEEALAAFQTAATFTDSKVYGYAQYMQAWCFFNLGDYRAALDMFKAVALFGELQGKSDPRSTALSKEARKDYVVAYSRVGDVLGAVRGVVDHDEGERARHGEDDPDDRLLWDALVLAARQREERRGDQREPDREELRAGRLGGEPEVDADQHAERGDLAEGEVDEDDLAPHDVDAEVGEDAREQEHRAQRRAEHVEEAERLHGSLAAVAASVSAKAWLKVSMRWSISAGKLGASGTPSG